MRIPAGLGWVIAYIATSLLVGLGWAMWYSLVYHTWPTGSYWANLKNFEIVMAGHGWNLAVAIWDTQAWRWFFAVVYPVVITAVLIFATYWTLAHLAIYYGVLRGRYAALEGHRPSRLETLAEILFRVFFAGAAATGFIMMLSNVPQWKELYISGRVGFGWISPYYQQGGVWVRDTAEHPFIVLLHMIFGISMGVVGIALFGFYLGRSAILRRRFSILVGRSYMKYVMNYMAFLAAPKRDPPGRPPHKFSFVKIFEYNGAAAGFIVIGVTGVAMAVWGPSIWGGVAYTMHVFEAILAVITALVLLIPFLYLKEVEGMGIPARSASPSKEDILKAGGE